MINPINEIISSSKNEIFAQNGLQHLIIKNNLMYEEDSIKGNNFNNFSNSEQLFLERPLS